MLRGNVGEWSEIYVLLKLLADGKLSAADDNLQLLNDIYFPIVKIIREESIGKPIDYVPGKTIRILYNEDLLGEFSSDRFNEEASRLFNSITDKSNRGAFQIERTEHFMNQIQCFKLSAPSTKKSDITIKIVDIHTGYSPTVGFSIKSELGSAPMLLNASKTTNFIYEVQGYIDSTIEETNSIYIVSKDKNHVDVKGRLKKLNDQNVLIKYKDMQSQTFKDNLILIDSKMDEIIAQTLLYFYREGINNCADMVAKLEQENPMNYGNVHAYSYKFKKFLTSIALGMRPGTKWDGVDEASGGYIVVKKDGNVVAYHIYNRNYFENYLLKNTKYETPSTSRHGFGELYKENGHTLMKLNLQIRFN